MFQWLVKFAGFVGPLFIVASPILSYSDQAYTMHKRKSSAGFSLDIPLIMLIASMFKIFYWPGAQFDKSLLMQAILMVLMQIIILKISLDHRPPPPSQPFAGESASAPRPFDFWQWRSPTPYWNFLLCVFIGLLVFELLFAPLPPIYERYSNMIGYIGLAVEAFLPVPQILTNKRARSCKGFRASVLANWLLGDSMKLLWFFTATSAIPSSFKLCAIVQSCCDAYLGYQFFLYGTGEGVVKDRSLALQQRAGGGAYPMFIPSIDAEAQSR